MKTFGPSRLSDYIRPPVGFSAERYQAILNKAVGEIADYSVMVVFSDGRVGSGTFVNTNGLNGILTAHHVARAAIRPNSRIHLVIARGAHKLEVLSDAFEPITIGGVEDNSRPGSGPDLSMLRILDAGLTARIHAHKSFLPLDGKDFSFFRRHPKRRMNWFIAGVPFERIEQAEPEGSPSGRVETLNGLVVRVDYCSLSERAGFDYLKVKVPAGGAKFPNSYAGMSGGGIWLVPLSCDEAGTVDSIRGEAPFLAGVCFFQSPARDSHRVIKGHGPDSVYVRTISQLRQITNSASADV